MSRNWSLIELKKLMTLDIDTVPVDASIEYPMVGVYSFGRGLFNRDPVHGSSTSYKTFYRLHSHHVVMSQLFGWEGALALCSEEFAGRFVSSQFPTFKIDEKKLDREYLGWVIRQPKFWRDLGSRAKGMGSRRKTLNPKALLEIKIPLPSLCEQRKIAAKVENLASRIGETSRLRQEVSEDTESLLIAMAHRNDLTEAEKASREWHRLTLAEALTQASDPVKVQPGKEYPHFGIYSFAKGLFRKNPLLGDEVKASKLFRVHSGQFIFARLNAYEGAFGLVDKEFEGHFTSNEFPTFNCNTEKILPEFLVAYFRCPRTWEDLKRQVTGIGGGAGNRRIRLKEKTFLSQELWVPPLDWQEKIKTTAGKLKEMSIFRNSTEAELDALLPAILDKAFNGEL